MMELSTCKRCGITPLKTVKYLKNKSVVVLTCPCCEEFVIAISMNKAVENWNELNKNSSI